MGKGVYNGSAGKSCSSEPHTEAEDTVNCSYLSWAPINCTRKPCNTATLMPWPFQAHLLHVKNPILFFLGIASKLTLPILTALKQLRIHPVSQHWDYQRAGAGFSLSQFRVPKVKNANITSQSPATQRHQHRSVSQQQHSQTKFLCWKEPQLKHLKQLTGTSPRSTNVMWTGGFNESDVFLSQNSINPHPTALRAPFLPSSCSSYLPV